MRPTSTTVSLKGAAIISAGMFLALSLMSFSGRSSSEFDLSQHSVPLKELRSGGPPKDGIPAILNPIFVQAKMASFLHDEDRVLGLSDGNQAKAYPVKILNWHEIVNDTIGGKPVLVTYCPLCGTGIGFDPVVNGRPVTFGVSGLLYQSDLVMYDHQPSTVRSLLREKPIETLPELINEMEMALSPLANLRDQIMEEPWSDQVLGILALYVRHMEQLVMKGRELVRGQQVS